MQIAEFISFHELELVGGLKYNTGFITNDVLSINLNYIYVVSEDKFYPNYFGLENDSGGQNPPQLPEGYTLDDYD